MNRLTFLTLITALLFATLAALHAATPCPKFQSLEMIARDISNDWNLYSRR